MSNPIYLDASFRVSIPISPEEVTYLVESGAVRINEGGEVDIEDHKALRYWIEYECNRHQDDTYLESVEIGE